MKVGNSLKTLHPNPIFCIIPPYMLRNIIEAGTQSQRDWAIQTIRLTSQLRGQRMAFLEAKEVTPVTSAVGKTRMVYSAGNNTSLPGQLVRAEGAPPSGDLAIDEAYDGAGATYDFFSNIYQRNSIDDQGMRLDSTVHYQKSYDNAFWNGQQMVYGDGDEDLPLDQRIFNRFTIAVDVIGHELTHGITQFDAGLAYIDQSGALNESISDVFGVLVKQYKLGQTAAQADWIIGQGLFTPNVKGAGIRSMKAPGTAYDDPVLGKDPQPAQMRDYITTADDNGGVHINSGIPNRAFYVTAFEIGGYAWEKAGKIWYTALKSKFQTRTTFQAAADLTDQVAVELYGSGSLEQKAVQKGWFEVGINVGASGSNTAPGCLPAVLRLLKLYTTK